jgi:hypothetical protein
MALAIVLALNPTPLEVDASQLRLLFFGGALQFAIAIVLSMRFLRDQANELNRAGQILNGAGNVFAVGFVIGILYVGLQHALAQRQPGKQFEAALGTYTETVAADKKDAIGDAAYGLFAACGRLKSEPDTSRRVLLQQECKGLLGTPPPLDRASGALQRTSGVGAVIGSSPIPSPSPHP